MVEVLSRMGKKRKAVRPGKVRKIIKAAHRDDKEKAEITVEGADELYKEIRVENTLQDEEGKEVALKPGANVAVTIEAEPHHTTPKNSQPDEVG